MASALTPQKEDLQQLLEIARDKSVRSRKALAAMISDLFSENCSVLTEREHALMTDIPNKLISDFEKKVRREISERLANRANVPMEVVRMLASDEIEVARPLLLVSEVLQDSDLIEIIRHRTIQHQLAIAMRRGVSETVSEALVEAGNIDVVKALLENPNAQLSEATMEYLVEESRRVDTYQEPLIRRQDLTPELAKRMCLWVSAALRSHVLANFDIDATDLDDLIEEVVREAAQVEPLQTASAMQDSSTRLAKRIAEDGKLSPEFLIQMLRQGEIPLFEALFAEMTQLRLRLVRRIIYEPGGEGLVIACRAMRIDKPAFTSIFLMSRKGRPGDQRVDPEELSRVITLFDKVKTGTATAVLKRWRRNPDYLYAVKQIEEAQSHTAAE